MTDITYDDNGLADDATIHDMANRHDFGPDGPRGNPNVTDMYDALAKHNSEAAEELWREWRGDSEANFRYAAKAAADLVAANPELESIPADLVDNPAVLRYLAKLGRAAAHPEQETSRMTTYTEHDTRGDSHADQHSTAYTRGRPINLNPLPGETLQATYDRLHQEYIGVMNRDPRAADKLFAAKIAIRERMEGGRR